jgi:MFS superfamily sulfate permease-like transporter
LRNTGADVALRRWAPRLPGPLIALSLASAIVFALALAVPTIGSRFGDFQFALPAPHWPACLSRAWPTCSPVPSRSRFWRASKACFARSSPTG